MIGIDILSKDNVFSRWVLVTFDDPGFDDFDVVDDLNFIFAGLSWKQTPVEVGNGRFPFGLESPIDSFADRIRIAYFDFQIVFPGFLTSSARIGRFCGLNFSSHSESFFWINSEQIFKSSSKKILPAGKRFEGFQ